MRYATAVGGREPYLTNTHFRPSNRGMMVGGTTRKSYDRRKQRTGRKNHYFREDRSIQRCSYSYHCYRNKLYYMQSEWGQHLFEGIFKRDVKYSTYDPEVDVIIQSKLYYLLKASLMISINGVVVTWVVAIDPPGVRFPLNAMFQNFLTCLFCLSACVFHYTC